MKVIDISTQSVERLGRAFWRTWRGLFSLMLFVRFSALGGTLILPLLGMASAGADPSPEATIGVVLVGVAFHCFAYVLNDVIDLPIDRGEPRRTDFPLVRGSVTPLQALVFALLMIPLALVLTIWLDANSSAFLALLAAFATITVYNLWGKRFPFPPLTDAVQGLSWGFLAAYGATLTPSGPGALTWFIFSYVIIFILMANGVHGSLRDLENDLRCGVLSTAILMGTRPVGDSGLHLSRHLTWYAICLQVILVMLSLASLAFNLYAYSPLEWILTIAAVLALSLLSFYLMYVAARSMDDRQALNACGLLHLLSCLVTLITLFALYMPAENLCITLAVFTLPLLTHSWLYASVRWILRRSMVAMRYEDTH